MKKAIIKNQQRLKRKKRTRSKILGTKERPRLTVQRSNNHIHLQAIDDEKGHTLISASTLQLKSKLPLTADSPLAKKIKKSDQVLKVSDILVQKIKEAGISAMVFDRGCYKYHGRIKIIVEILRKEGIKI
ncbi:MAG: 50S ribosomal protein L18 [Candidatus Liptonbacteria bacterium]|nr:50S ribosomal protein L18 [Candidatus Liptonbacteria bacterium]